MSASARSKTKSFFGATSKRIAYYLEHHPVASNSILCLNLWVAGDIVAQYSENKLIPHGDGNDKHDGSQESQTSSSTFWKDHLDLTRTAQCASYGAFVTGPILALWYPYMDRVCQKYKLALKYGPWAAPIAKVAADEFLMDPPTLLLFFGYMNVCEGGDRKDFVEKVRTQFLPSWYTSLAVWPVVLLGTFRFLPVPVQAPVINVCCIVWDAFLSHRNALAKHAKLEAENAEKQVNESDDD